MLGIIALAVQVGSQIYQGVQSINAARANRRFANRAAREAIEVGEENVGIYRRDLARLLGAQRATAAAAMLDPDVGSVAQLRTQTEQFGEQDIATIRRNAQREAWGIRAQGQLNYRAQMAQGVGQLIGAGYQALNTPIGGSTLLDRAQDGWTNYIGTRRVNRLVSQNPGGFANAFGGR